MVLPSQKTLVQDSRFLSFRWYNFFSSGRPLACNAFVICLMSSLVRSSDVVGRELAWWIECERVLNLCCLSCCGIRIEVSISRR